jgi:hypothetical protein
MLALFVSTFRWEPESVVTLEEIEQACHDVELRDLAKDQTSHFFSPIQNTARKPTNLHEHYFPIHLNPNLLCSILLSVVILLTTHDHK